MTMMTMALRIARTLTQMTFSNRARENAKRDCRQATPLFFRHQRISTQLRARRNRAHHIRSALRRWRCIAARSNLNRRFVDPHLVASMQ